MQYISRFSAKIKLTHDEVLNFEILKTFKDLKSICLFKYAKMNLCLFHSHLNTPYTPPFPAPTKETHAKDHLQITLLLSLVIQTKIKRVSILIQSSFLSEHHISFQEILVYILLENSIYYRNTFITRYRVCNGTSNGL